MQEYFIKEVEELNTNIIKMAAIVIEQIEKSMHILETANIELYDEMKGKEIEVDAFDNLIKTQCENLLALFQPVASDLRLIMSALTINNQLERCGDIAVNIALRAKETSRNHGFVNETQIFEMSRHAADMVKNAIDSYLNLNTELADKVINNDSQVNELNKSIFNFVVNKMQTESGCIEVGAHLIALSRQIERLADHATNIAEETIFYKNAIIIAHKKKLEKLEEI